MSGFKAVTRYIFGGFFVLAGINHFIHPAFYVSIMPPCLPWHPALVYISGVAEVLFGALLLFKPWQALAGWGLIALLIAVFPANVHMALHPDLYPATPRWALWLRLPLQ